MHCTTCRLRDWSAERARSELAQVARRAATKPTAKNIAAVEAAKQKRDLERAAKEKHAAECQAVTL